MSRLGRAATVLLAAALSAAGLGLGASAGGAVVLVFGPSDHTYTSGFRTERERGARRRWAKAEAAITLPFRVRFPSRLVIEGARPGAAPATVAIRQDGGPAVDHVVGPEERSLALAIAPAEELRVLLHARDTDQNRSLELAKVVLLPAGAGAVVPKAAALRDAALAAGLLSAVLLLAGISAPRSLLGAVALVGLPLTLLALRDPLAAVHLARKALLLQPPLLAAVVLLPRDRARVWLPVLALAMLSRLAVFHPGYDYQDVAIHHEVTRVAVREGPVELWRNMTHYQQVFDLGRASAGSGYRPFPYPPTFHTLAALLPVADTQDAIKLLGIVCQGAGVLLLMELARRLSGPGPPELLAGLFASFFPADVLELLRASYPALLGHAVDLGVMAVLVTRWAALLTARGLLVLTLGLAAAALTYNAAPVHWAVLVPLLLLVASWPPPLEGRLPLAGAAVLGGLLSLVYYGRHLEWTVRQALAGHAGASPQQALGDRLAAVLSPGDVPGIPYLLAFGAGLFVLLRRRWPDAEARVVLAWALFPLAVLAPVLLSPEPFRYFRKFYFAFPLFPLLAAFLLARARGPEIVAAGLLLAWSLARILGFAGEFFRT